MSQFNIYARKLDTAFKEARSEYNTAFRALQEAQQASRDANAWKPGDSAEEKQVRTTRAALKLHDAEATFNEVSARVWDNFKATRRTIRAELNISPSYRLTVLLRPSDAHQKDVLEANREVILTLARLGELIIDAKRRGSRVERLFLTGPTNIVCKGEITDEALTI
mgnify:CR=1 FL=1